jgi:hypothetical protein
MIISKFSNNQNIFSVNNSVKEIITVINRLKHFAKQNNLKQINISVFSKEYSKIFNNFGFIQPPLKMINEYNLKLKSLGVTGIDEIIDRNHFFVTNKENKLIALENKELYKYIPFCVYKVK